MVEKIVERARGNDVRGPVSQLHFKVAWIGHPGGDTIEPWKELRKLKCFKKFLEEHSNKGYRDLVKKLPSTVNELEEIEDGKEQEQDREPPVEIDQTPRHESIPIEIGTNQRHSKREAKKTTRLIEEK